MNFGVNRNVWLASFGMFFVFMGFDAAQQYLIPILKIRGQENLALSPC